MPLGIQWDVCISHPEGGKYWKLVIQNTVRAQLATAEPEALQNNPSALAEAPDYRAGCPGHLDFRTLIRSIIGIFDPKGVRW